MIIILMIIILIIIIITLGVDYREKPMVIIKCWLDFRIGKVQEKVQEWEKCRN